MDGYKLFCGTHNGLQILLIVLSILTRGSIAGPSLILQVIGFSIAALALALQIYAGVHLRRAARGEDLDQREALATQGPYRWVRHPYYLSDIFVILGLSVGFRSLWATIATLLLLVPSAIYTAKLEEEMLAEKFGEVWKSFAERTYFMFPPIY